MAHEAVPNDTGAEAFKIQWARIAQLTVAERVELVDQVCADVELLAIAGIRAGRPEMTEVELRHELARRRFGDVLADAAYRDLLP